MKKHDSKNDADWAEAKRRCRLNAEDVRMAKELRLNPRSLIKNIPSPSQRWKQPVKDWIRELYAKKHPAPSQERTDRPAPATPLPVVLADGPEVDAFDEELEEEEFFELERSLDEDPHDPRVVAENNERMLRRQREFRTAAEFIAGAFSQFPEVLRVTLFGSVAVPLKKEVPCWRAFRRAGVVVFHECKDVNVAVWLTRLDNLHALGKARGQALNQLLARTGIGVAHHQVDVFVLEPGTDRYLGRLCDFGVCPKGKRECLVPGCGASPFLQQHEGFRLHSDALRPDRTIVLFERTPGGEQGEMDEIPF